MVCGPVTEDPEDSGSDREDPGKDGGGAAPGWVGLGLQEVRGSWGGVIHRAEVWEER